MKKIPLKLLSGLLLVAAVTIIVIVANTTTVVALDQSNCLSCHGSEKLSKTDQNGNKISLFVDSVSASSGAHRYIDCTTCHTTEPHKQSTPLTKQSLAEKCGSCHQYEYEQHLNSIHGQQLSQGNNDVATCVDCHSPTSNPHDIIRVLEYSAPAYKKNIAETCAKCHNDQALMESYGIVERVYTSYMKSFHGKALQLSTYEISQLDEATCTSCHGTHDIKATDDPSSPVAGLENLANTCETCHPGAGVNFASGFLGHKEASPDNIPAAHYTDILFRIILISVVSFGGIIVLAAIIRFSINKWRD